ncbi:MAG: hypothetical protein OXH57_09930 [Ekhidna sp.]|nr:hypothetical protein [Ekhidna sp.]
MKNEERIVELLAESLKRQDQQADILTRLVAIVSEQGKDLQDQKVLLQKVVSSIEHMADIFESKFIQVNEHEKRITRLEDKLFN